MKYGMVRTPGHWIIVGLVEYVDEKEIVFARGTVVRQWGTTKGLGEILPGPTSKTVLDPMPGRIRIDRGPGVFFVECGDGWARALGGEP